MMLKISNLQVYYGHSEAISNVNMAVPEKGIIAILGANGSGKSTTLRTVSGLLVPRKGEIKFQNRLINGLPPHQVVKLGISQVPEGRELFLNLSVQENLMAGQYTRRDKTEISRNWERVVEWFPVLGERLQQAAGTLSGGEQQMLAIGRAFLANPILLLLDEPSLGISPLHVRNIFQTIADINKKAGLTIIVAEQNVRMALSIAGRGYIMELGRVVLEGASKSLTEDKSVLESYLGVL